MLDWLNWDLATTVITIAVFVVAVIVAYARGYSAGHDNGYAEAALSSRDLQIRGAVQDYGQRVLGRALSVSEAAALAALFVRHLDEEEAN